MPRRTSAIFPNDGSVSVAVSSDEIMPSPRRELLIYFVQDDRRSETTNAGACTPRLRPCTDACHEPTSETTGLQAKCSFMQIYFCPTLHNSLDAGGINIRTDFARKAMFRTNLRSILVSEMTYQLHFVLNAKRLEGLGLDYMSNPDGRLAVTATMKWKLPDQVCKRDH